MPRKGVSGEFDESETYRKFRLVMTMSRGS